MPISIQCPTCLHTLSVDESLRGQKTTCSRCGGEVLIPALSPPPPETFAIAEEKPKDPAAASLEDIAETPGEACPLCGTTVPPDVALCPSCSFDCRTAAPPEKDMPSDPTYVHRRLHRPLTHRLLAAFSTFDSFLSTFLFFVLLAGITVWCFHLSSQPGGFYFRNLLPALFMIAAVFLFITPITVIAVKIAYAFLKREEPDGIYRRCASILTLPVALNLFSTGDPPLTHIDTHLILPVWIASLGLFAYFFRDALRKMLVTLLTFMVALVIGWSLLTTAISKFPTFSDALYKDMSPPGLFVQFATGQSPPPDVAATEPEPAATTQTVVLPKEIQQLAHEMAPESSPLEPDTQIPALPTDTQIATPTPSPVPQPQPQLPVAVHPVVPTAPHPVLPHTPPVASPDSPVAAGNIPLKIITHPDLQNVRSLLMSNIPSAYMLIIKGSDGEAIVQRWKIDPLQNINEVRFSELPKQPNDYALSPSGATLVTISRFPQNQLQITAFENNKPITRKIPLDRKEWDGTPTLVGFIDPAHFLMRWSISGLLQVWSTDGVMSATTRTEAFNDNQNEWAINPNSIRSGASLAAILRGADRFDQLVVCRIQGWQLLRRISPMNRHFVTAGVAFSPDAASIALCSSTADGASILAFDLGTGENTVSATFTNDLLHANPNLDRRHGLLWTQNGQYFLAGGNELFDAPTGKHLGSLGLQNIDDAYNAGPASILFLQTTPAGERRVFIGRINLPVAKPPDAYEKH